MRVRASAVNRLALGTVAVLISWLLSPNLFHPDVTSVWADTSSFDQVRIFRGLRFREVLMTLPDGSHVLSPEEMISINTSEITAQLPLHFCAPGARTCGYLNLVVYDPPNSVP